MEIHRLSTPGEEFQIQEIKGDCHPHHPVIIDCYSLHICHGGTGKSYCNLREFTIGKGQFVINMPGQIIHYTAVSQDYHGTTVFLSQDFMRGLGFPYNFEINKLIESNPVLTLNEKEYEAALGYYRLVSGVVRNNHRFQIEILRHLTCAYLYGFAHCVTLVNPGAPPGSRDVITGKFFDLLKDNYRRERSVKFYADRLCVTPGYLATMVKSSTGRTVTEWIAEYVILEAKALLHDSDSSIQEISIGLNFSDQSFFGKYFKRSTGQSPAEYRRKCKEM